ncbi:MAG: hypothetical protein ABSD74_18935 [Rhizomicrobium sp.]|jgi:hypothetical protein
MNKYLLMSAAAALATTAAGSAQAGSFSVHYGTAGGGSYCDGLIGTSDYASNWSVGEHVYTHCSSTDTNLVTLGFDTKGDKEIPKGGKKGGTITWSDMTFGYNYHENYGIAYQTEYPVKAGGKWDLWVAFSSSSTFLGNDGVLLSGQFAKVGGSHQSTVAKIATALKSK